MQRYQATIIRQIEVAGILRQILCHMRNVTRSGISVDWPVRAVAGSGRTSSGAGHDQGHRQSHCPYRSGNLVFHTELGRIRYWGAFAIAFRSLPNFGWSEPAPFCLMPATDFWKPCCNGVF